MNSATASSGPSSRQVSSVWEKVARTGYAVSGLIHVLLGVTIARIGLGSGGEADQSAALGQIAAAPFGAAVLWIAVVAFVGLGAWQIADALASHHESSDRAKAVGKAVLYLSLAFTAGSLVIGAGGSSGGSQDDKAQGLAAGLMGAPAGRILVGVVGLGILAGGAYHVYKGAKKKFLEDLQATPGGELGRGVRLLGTIGYIAKGVALAVVGVLFVLAAATADPAQAQGIDGAVETLLGAPGGPVVVVLVGIGFAAFGVYSFARARYAKM
ncbi:hypothetical protein C8046_06030 [Serinibacter arcticus]|uniref:DUF1206 domain-containing protein n=1 Tax=Serinibacter arcticus TaxID=1655435 RepID=A0A2U1ZTH3_9MICO|nr:DUF1206 domain-containing protein [Serinibacter arcticus]PWD50288.1 hypothetical protein C8046_06030 [Serinibacter arcticus]